MYRGQRRRYTRRRQRIAWLQELLKDDVLQKDENFYMKLKERNLVEEDKSDFGDFSEILDKNLVKRMKAYKSHILTKKSQKRKRNLRKATITDPTNAKVMKKILPY